MPRDIVFDLTEVLLASTGKLRFYGIMRVVAEIGVELARLGAPVRFCLHSPGHDAFFEVRPRIGEGGEVDLGVPEGIRQRRLRSRFYNPNRLRDALAPAIRAGLAGLNRRAWEAGAPDLPRLDLDGAVFVSCARPKLIVDMMATLERQGAAPLLVPYLHDMIPLHDYFEHRQKDFPTNFIGDNRTVVAAARRVLANSAFTRDEILSFSARGDLPPVSDVRAVPLVHECPPGEGPPTAPVPGEPYVLTVGTTLGRKNLGAIYDALRDLRARGRPAPRLVVAGAVRKRTAKHLKSEEMAPIRDLVELRHSPAQSDLVALYRGAVAVLVPSRMEGWGLPAGEALWLGTPAICSTAPVFREVCGDLGLYFDPDDPAALAAHIDRLISDPRHAERLRARIAAAKPSLRTWEHVARDLLDAVSDLR